MGDASTPPSSFQVMEFIYKEGKALFGGMDSQIEDCLSLVQSRKSSGFHGDSTRWNAPKQGWAKRKEREEGWELHKKAFPHTDDAQQQLRAGEGKQRPEEMEGGITGWENRWASVCERECLQEKDKVEKPRAKGSESVWYEERKMFEANYF